MKKGKITRGDVDDKARDKEMIIGVAVRHDEAEAAKYLG